MPSKTSTSTARSPSPEESASTVEDLFFTRTVEFAFHRQRVRFDLARTVFASASIDPGSALLLRHLQAVGVPDGVRVLDVGAGHGTLGIVLGALDRSRQLTFVDRDALACAFTRRNLARNELVTGVKAEAGHLVRGSLGYDAIADHDPFDVVVSNIPGKAGDAVIGELVSGAAGVAKLGASVGFVVVEPLAELLESLLVPPTFEPILVKGNKTHVVAVGRVAAKSADGEHEKQRDGRSSFDRGIYDRTTEEFSSAGLGWTATTVTGIDEFDNLAQSTRLLRGALQGVRAGPSVVVHPGQGHRAMVAALAGYRPAAVVGRDLLALRATQRCLSANNIDGEPALVHAVGVPTEWYDRASLHLLHADDKVHGPWFTAEVIRYLDHVEASSDSRRCDLVLTGRSGLLGRLEADVLQRRKGRVVHKKTVKGHRALRYVTGR